MPLLAERYKIVALDLPGRATPTALRTDTTHRVSQAWFHGLLQQLGISEYFLAAHDVGAWVAYPYAALFGNEVRRLALLDAGIPGITLPDALPIAPERAWRTWHFAFHAIPDLPEMLIAGREREYLDWFLRRKTANPESFSDADVDEYLRVFKKDGGLRAGLAYYRARSPVCATESRTMRQGKIENACAGARLRPKGPFGHRCCSAQGFCRRRSRRHDRVLRPLSSGRTTGSGRSRTDRLL